MSSQNTRASGSRKRAALHRFFLLHPRPNANAEELAERIMELPSVQEVYLTDGDFGYLVKARFFGDREPRDVVRYLSGSIGKKFGTLTSYYKYQK